MIRILLISFFVCRQQREKGQQNGSCCMNSPAVFNFFSKLRGPGKAVKITWWRKLRSSEGHFKQTQPYHTIFFQRNHLMYNILYPTMILYKMFVCIENREPPVATIGFDHPHLSQLLCHVAGIYFMKPPELCSSIHLQCWSAVEFGPGPVLNVLV